MKLAWDPTLMKVLAGIALGWMIATVLMHYFGHH